jgi:hypothetical protein
MGTSWSLFEIGKVKKIISTLLFLMFFLVTGISLFFSVDPLSSAVWGKERILGQEIYSLRKKLAGNDGITYN